MNDTVRRTTLSEAAYDAIRRKIDTGALAPSSKLVVGTLASSLGLSATPVNEALSALEREGLVTYLPHRGYFVSDVTPDHVEEVYSVREVFELLAVKLAAQRAEPRTVERLQALLQDMREAIRRGDTSTFSDLDIEFHRVIWLSTNNSLAARIGELIGGQIRLLVASTARAPGRVRGAFEEHSQIYRAIRDRNGKAAIQAMRQHIRNAQGALARANAIKSAEPAPATRKRARKKAAKR